MGRLGRICFALWLALWLSLGGAVAQLSSSVEFERWERLASQAEAAIDQNRGDDATFEAYRESVAEFRAQFDATRDLNAARITALREQIAALGPKQEGDGAEPEPPDVAAQREDLTTQLAALLEPVQRAEAAFVRADALVAQIDGILRERQTQKLLKVVPSPLNPVNWGPAVTHLRQSVGVLWQERPLRDDSRSWQDLRETLPVTVLLAGLGVLLILRGRRWSKNIVNRLQRLGARGFGIWRFLVSLLRIILPFAGLVLLALAAISADLVGPKGNEVILILAVLGGIMLTMRWISERVFSKDDDEALILVGDGQRRMARAHVWVITSLILLGELVQQLMEVAPSAGATELVLIFPFFLGACISLFGLGRILRGYRDEADQDGGLEEVRTSTYRRIVRALGSGAVVVACLTPLLMAAGYLNAALALMPPYIMTLAILGLVLVLQRFSADVYGALSGQGIAAREALMPVLFGLLLFLGALPALALVWGARLTDLTELWSVVQRGFAIGETRISPTDFIAFAVIFAIGYVATRLLQSALRGSVLPKTRMDVGGQNAVVSGVGYVGIFLAALAAITGAGIDLSSLAIVVGALSVGIGFGLQNIVSNFVSGIILLIERPIAEGDWIEVGGQMGYVRTISVRSTRIETFDRTDVIVPNADLVSGTVTNYTRGNTVGRLIVPVGVAYGNDTQRIADILKEIAEAQPMVLHKPPPNVLFLNFGADALEFEIRCFLRDVNWMMLVKSDINHAVAKRFAEEGIEIPFAQRDIWLRNPEVLRQVPESNKNEGET